VAFPFMPLTNEMLKKLSRSIKDPDQILISSDLIPDFASQEFKSDLELKPPHSETDQSAFRTKSYS